LRNFPEKFAPIAEKFSMTWRIAPSSYRPRVAIFVSKHDHCLVDLLYRQRNGELACEIAVIVSNHPDAKPHADFYGIPYRIIPVTKETKPEAERQELELLKSNEIGLIVLARYMQVLSSEFISHFPQRIINIHHSFLPAFVGGKPHVQAYERGVKLIGATAHYVTDDLDEGPIIEQDVARVDHASAVSDLVAIGRDVECMVLSRAVKYHIAQRVLPNGPRTVVFR